MGRRIMVAVVCLVMPVVVLAQGASGVAQQIVRGRLRTACKHSGIDRVRTYEVSSGEIPRAFDGFRILFITDTHYPSRFDEEALEGLEELIEELSADAMILGGDYQEGCEYVDRIIGGLMKRVPRYGAYGVLGNNDKERCTDSIKSTMRAYGVTMVEDTAVMIEKGYSHIVVAGAVNLFRGVEKTPSPTLGLKGGDFVILVTHTPDYAEEQDITNADLTLAGHTHGGQVTLFGAIAPVTSSRYGQRFLKGLNYTSAGRAVITSTGIGTSRLAVRLFAPSEVVLLTLRSWSHGDLLPSPDVEYGNGVHLTQPIKYRRRIRQETLEKPSKM